MQLNHPLALSDFSKIWYIRPDLVGALDQLELKREPVGEAERVDDTGSMDLFFFIGTRPQTHLPPSQNFPILSTSCGQLSAGWKYHHHSM